MPRKPWLLALALVLALGACSGDKDDKDKDKDQEKTVKTDKDAKPPICPQVAIVRELSEMRDYGREKPDPTLLVAAARMKGIDGDCSFKDEGIDIEFSVHFVAARGPRLGGKRMEFPFFVAVVDPAQKVLNKELLTAEFKFSGDDPTTDHDEDLHVFIPLAKAAQKAAPDYRVLAGFQLTEDQVEALRKDEVGFSRP